MGLDRYSITPPGFGAISLLICSLRGAINIIPHQGSVQFRAERDDTDKRKGARVSTSPVRSVCKEVYHRQQFQERLGGFDYAKQEEKP